MYNRVTSNHKSVEITFAQLFLEINMSRRVSLEDWIGLEEKNLPDDKWSTMMSRVAVFHHKHSFASEESRGHDMGYRIALTVEELGELSAAITKGKPMKHIAEELADLLILLLGHSLAMDIDLEYEFHKKMDKIMMRDSKIGGLGVRVTEYSD
ncbi:MAG: pyrophosphatase [Euryarchaeota archaeon]|nr:pyrophosphatase [Euryarchaeota archaeon]